MTPYEEGSFLAELSPDDRDDLQRLGRPRAFRRGETIFREGEHSTWAAVLTSGHVKAYSDREQGGEALLAVRGPGALLGEVAVIDGGPRSATVAALEPVKLLTITGEQFMEFLRTHGGASVLIMRTLCQRFRDADRKRIEFGMFDATGRVAQRLVELAERFGVPDDTAAGGGVRINLNLSQEELAGWVGASREAVSKALGTLRRHGLIETGRRKFVVRDLPALRRHAR
ncbi:Crp/Fnr family transcriptional regulator [Actinomadura rayongensis]|uniref:Cyclic nucleotide-binding domain-containing protein n=1 Tax=Actinomadura rayongensis TaxID=1429076 RepID=A0A6I4WA75_9ACTN|nr:Crp/Fnr family transcriptional regulator [Actinomadura rayongensis]MXQ66073.1 cyclic nucleotide-binding domain-containing protein [Actinomadura rayongensis]